MARHYTSSGDRNAPLLYSQVFLHAPRAAIMTFQDLILTLQKFLAEQGCVIVQPMDMEMGAGTFPLATFLRAVGPETWHTVYGKPSRRPHAGGSRENQLETATGQGRSVKQCYMAVDYVLIRTKT